jgi:hypothetical protein
MHPKSLLISLLIIAAGTLSGPVVHAGDAPPAAPPGQQWVAGHWEWSGTEYIWRAGQWQATAGPAPAAQVQAPAVAPPPTTPAQAPPTPPPQPTAANQQWIPGHWEQGANGWQYNSGHYESPPAAPLVVAPAPVSAEPQVVFVQNAPPPDRREYITEAPSPDHVWIRGYWSWQGGAWLWMSGHWERRHHHDDQWEQGHWVQTAHGWEWHDGHWH